MTPTGKAAWKYFKKKYPMLWYAKEPESLIIITLVSFVVSICTSNSWLLCSVGVIVGLLAYSLIIIPISFLLWNIIYTEKQNVNNNNL